MSFPILGNKVLQEETLVSPDRFVAYRRSQNRVSDLQGAEAAIIYFHKTAEDWLLQSVLHRQIEHFSSAHLVLKNSKPVVLVRSGIGAPAAVVILEELIAHGIKRVIGVGTAGGLRRGLEPGSIVVCNRAYRDEGVSHHYLASHEYIDADEPGVRVLRDALDRRGLSHIAGASWTMDAPYRETSNEVELFAGKGVATVEMEAAALMSVARFRDVSFVAGFVVSDILTPQAWIPHFANAKVTHQLNALLDAAIDALTQ